MTTVNTNLIRNLQRKSSTLSSAGAASVFNLTGNTQLVGSEERRSLRKIARSRYLDGNTGTYPIGRDAINAEDTVLAVVTFGDAIIPETPDTVFAVSSVPAPTVVITDPNATVTPTRVAAVASVGSPALNPLPTAHLLRNTFENGSNGTTLTSLLSSYAGDQFSQVTDVVGNTITYDTSTFANGTRSIKINTTSNAYFWWKDFDLGSAPFSTTYVRFYLRMDANPSAVRRIFQLDDSTAATSAAIAITTTGTVRVINGVGNDQVTTSSIPLGSWCRIELKVVHSTTAGSSELRLYNTPNSLVPTQTVTSTGTNYGTNGNQARFGNTANVTQLLWLDDVAISPTDWIQNSVTAGTVLDRWQGAVTDTTAAITFNTLSITSARVGYTTNSNLTSPTYTAYQTIAANGITRFNLSGLTADTTYYFFLEDSTGQKYHDANSKGSLKTFPTPGTQTNFTVTFGGCSTSLSTTDAWYGAASHGARFFMHTGDIHYEDVASNSDTLVRDSWRVATKKQAVRQALRDMPMDYIFDDHDAGGNSVDLNTVTLPAVHNLYRERVPYYTLPASDTANHTFVIGRVRFIVLDCRSKRSPTGNTDNSSKTVLGSTQKTWLFDTLDAATEKAIVIVSSIVWHASSTSLDTWGAYTTERTEIVNHITSNNIKGVMFMCGDSHMVAADSGANAPGGFPVVVAAPMSNTGTVKGGGTWSQSTYPTADDAGTTYRQYGILSFTDTGNAVSISFTGRDYANSTDRITLSKLLWGDATITGSTIAGAASVGQVAVPRFPDTVAGVGTVGTPTVTTSGGNADITASIVSAVATVPAPNIPATEEATTVAGVGTVGTPTLLTSVTIAASVVAGVGTVGTGRVAPVANLTTVSGVGTVGSPTLLTSVTISPATVAGTATLPAPNIPAIEQADAVLGVATVGSPVVQASQTVAASVVAGVATVGVALVTPVANLTTVAGVATVGVARVQPAANITTVAGVVTVSAPVVSGAANVIPTVVSGVASVGVPVVQVSQTVAASVVSAVASVGTAQVAPVANLATVSGVATVGSVTVQVSQTVTASIVSGVATVGTPVVSGRVTITPAVVAGVASVGAPTLQTSQTVAAAVVAGVATVGTPGITLVAGVAVVSGVATVGAPVVSGTVNVTPSAVAGVGTVGSPVVQTSQTVAASVVSGVATVGTARVSPVAGLTTVVGVGTVGAPTVQASQTVSASIVNGVATVGAPVVSGRVNVTPAVVAGVATVGAPVVQASQTVSASVVAGVATVGTPGITLVAGVSVVAGVATVGSPVVQTSSTVTPTVVAGTATVGSITFTSAATATPSIVNGTATVGTANVQPAQAATVNGVGTVGSPSISTQGNVNVAPSVVSGVATVGTATLSTSSTVTPSRVSAVATVGTVVVPLGPATINTTGTVGSVVVQAGAVATPTVIAGTATVGTPGITLVAGVSNVAGTATVGSPVVRASSTVTPSVIAGVATVGTAVFTSGAAVATSVVAGTATVGTAVLSASSTATPSLVTGVATVGSATVTAGSANTANPSVVSVAATVGAPTLSTGSTIAASAVSATASVATPGITLVAGVSSVSAAATVGSPTLSASSAATPARVSAIATVGAPTVTASSGATVTPSVVSAVTTVPSPTEQAGATITPPTISAGTTLPDLGVGSPHVVIGDVTIIAGSTLSVALVTATAAVPGPTPAAGTLASPSAVTVTVAVPLPNLFAGAAATPTTVGGVATIGAASLAGSALIAAALIEAFADVGVPIVTTRRTPFRGWGVPIR